MPLTSTEAHRLACEARWLLSLPLTKRREYLKNIEPRRGAKAVETLKAELQRQWRGRS